ncbi:calumenin [Cyclospora cayetanensis]|uniref:Membrane-associated calcum-binding n=2 Tax=Cyclospora cayetanensis TaxID=88456 RepID=A0A1D3CZR7_9EIME|nr:calumenin [Cyclospora cayetanensis]OEH76706.1 membrane-associated calcum-binding [Cyclospora cayetanensis]
MKFTTSAAVAAVVVLMSAGTEGSSPTEQTPKLSGEKLAELMQLSLREIRKRMDSIFALVDTDKNDEISKDEAEKWSTKLKEAMHKHQVKQEFISIDKNNDGKITLEELEVTYTDGADAANQEAHKQEVHKRFVAVDKDKSGSLSLEEVTILMDPGKDDVLMQIEVDEIMAAQDKDKDGSISLDEFLLNEGGTLTDPEKEELTKEFSTYDKNSDGKIDEAELRTVIEDPHAHDLQQMLDALNAEMEDGKITKDQWQDKFETFSVSMLTDNGELLRFPEEYEGIELPFQGISVGPGEEDELKHDEL